ncbi:hypothetical protein [Fuchsiella alkaliacetigena]|uniref:hypothetical protein n=1 Tax=Fuchsiella alkaliacetigena TaxID=957042 RepID=UPI00200A848C|nr:hypothetical protein [Fuchsiella alkaliacetigena]MCK8825219.1 hypothetical protein [Fuchsiella alkaliacetigena]
MNKNKADILVVGICASGKSSVVDRLQELGYQAKSCAQEHSYVKSLWSKLEPNFMVVLDCDYETIRERRDVQWGLNRIKMQKERLQHAIENCDLYLQTDELSIEETVQIIVDKYQQ